LNRRRRWRRGRRRSWKKRKRARKRQKPIIKRILDRQYWNLIGNKRSRSFRRRNIRKSQQTL
jgi:hypothetical protein